MVKCIPWTPTLDNTCQQDLLGVIASIWSQTPDGATIMAITTFYNFWFLHDRTKQQENLGQR